MRTIIIFNYRYRPERSLLCDDCSSICRRARERKDRRNVTERNILSNLVPTAIGNRGRVNSQNSLILINASADRAIFVTKRNNCLNSYR